MLVKDLVALGINQNSAHISSFSQLQGMVSECFPSHVSTSKLIICQWMIFRKIRRNIHSRLAQGAGAEADEKSRVPKSASILTLLAERRQSN